VGCGNHTRHFDHCVLVGGTVTISEQHVVEPTIDGPSIGLVGQFVVLAALATSVGLGSAGWLVGTAFAVIVCTALGRAMHRSGMHMLGPANRVTLFRATLVGGVLALVGDSLRGHPPVVTIVAFAAVALVLDGVDGKVARRTGTSTALGARFDLEIDAILILGLSVLVAESLGWWVLAIGALRYVFVAAQQVLPWLRGSLPHRYSRKVVAATQGVVLVVTASGVLPQVMAIAAVALALGTLCWSFGRDSQWLWRAKVLTAR
jgi:phosphatidylglycerophosphate synthase